MLINLELKKSICLYKSTVLAFLGGEKYLFFIDCIVIFSLVYSKNVSLVVIIHRTVTQSHFSILKTDIKW